MYHLTSVYCWPPPGSQRTARTGRRSREREAGRARGRLGGGGGAGGSPSREASLDLPASFHGVGPSGGGSPPPPARRRGAEPDSGEATLSAGVALARARARAHAQAVERRERAEARGARRHVPVPLVHPVLLLRGIVTLRLGGARRVGAGFLCAGVPRVPTPGCLRGVGQGLVPCASPTGDGASGMLWERAPDLHPGGMSRAAAARWDGGEWLSYPCPGSL